MFIDFIVIDLLSRRSCFGMGAPKRFRLFDFRRLHPKSIIEHQTLPQPDAATSEAEAGTPRRAKLETAQDFARQVAALGYEKSELLECLKHTVQDLKRRLAEASQAARENAGEREAVIALLQDPETRDLSIREIARRAGLSPRS